MPNGGVSPQSAVAETITFVVVVASSVSRRRTTGRGFDSRLLQQTSCLEGLSGALKYVPPGRPVGQYIALWGHILRHWGAAAGGTTCGTCGGIVAPETGCFVSDSLKVRDL